MYFTIKIDILHCKNILYLIYEFHANAQNCLIVNVKIILLVYIYNHNLTASIIRFDPNNKRIYYVLHVRWNNLRTVKKNTNFLYNFSEKYLHTLAWKKHQYTTMCMKNLEMDRHKMTFTTIYMSKVNRMVPITMITHALHQILLTLEIGVIIAISVILPHRVEITYYLYSNMIYPITN